MKQNINIEAEGNELILKNKAGDYVIIPKKYRLEVQDMIKENCHSCIDKLVETLPVMEDYAPDGSVIPNDKKNNFEYKPYTAVQDNTYVAPRVVIPLEQKKKQQFVPREQPVLKADNRTDQERKIAQEYTESVLNPSISTQIGEAFQKPLRWLADPVKGVGDIASAIAPNSALAKDLPNTNEDIFEYRKKQLNPYISNKEKINNTINEAVPLTNWAMLNILPVEAAAGNMIKSGKNLIKPVNKVVSKTDDVVKPIVSSVDDVNPFKGKYDLPDSYKQHILENYRQKNLKELNLKEADEVLENFITRINTPEGKKRMKELGILYPDDAIKFYKDLKIYADDNTYAYYSSNRSRIGMNPELNTKDHATRHEIEHSVRDVISTQKMNKYNDDVGNFRYLFNRSKGKKALADAKKLTTEIDDLLSNLELKIEPESVNWNEIKSERQGKIRDASQVTKYFEDDRRATNYFASGSKGNEKSAFLGEVQQYMMSTGIIPKTEYINITPETIKQTMISAAFDEKNNGKYLRLFRIMKPSDFNYDLISKALNKMLSVPAAIGTGAAIQSQNQNKSEQ